MNLFTRQLAIVISVDPACSIIVVYTGNCMHGCAPLFYLLTFANY
jgi:hypothetical protein